MRRILSCSIVAVLAFMLMGGVGAQSDKRSQKQPSPAAPADQQDTIRIDTNLVTVPVVASDRNDVYIPDLSKEEFSIFEDGVRQEIVFFAAIKEPFNVVLMLDTSASTQEKLGQIKQAARAFVEQLQPADKVKIIAFDDSIQDLCQFSSDRTELRRAIESTRAGKGTKLYDAVKFSLNSLSRMKGARQWSFSPTASTGTAIRRSTTITSDRSKNQA
ncbi:MAG: VWA domain-containing protein [Acidobacteria bacterium]|nr:VWA domain-containing protein [Acidobacteriota bacterium]